MSRITQVTIKGFQSHINSTFKLAPGLTVITGPSDAGKTAVIRALRWVAFNEPQGEGFLFTLRNEKTGEIERQAEIAEVTVEFGNGVSITKTRRKGKTSYRHSAFIEPWEKAEVPQEIKEALGLYKQSYGDNFETCLNFAYQLEAPFVLSETPGVGAKILGKLAGTEVVDKAIAAISKNTYKTREEVRQAEKAINELNFELLEYLEVDNLKEQVEACEAVLEAIETNVKQSETLTAYYGQYSTAEGVIEALIVKLEALAIVPVLGASIIEVETSFKRYDTLEDLAADYFNADSWLRNLGIELARYKKIGEAALLIGTVEQNSDRLTTVKDLSSLYTKYSQTIITTSEILGKVKGISQIEIGLETLEESVARQDTLTQLNGQYTNFNSTIQARATYLTRFTSLGEATELLNKTMKDVGRLTQLQQLKTEYSKKDTGVQQALQALKTTEAAYWTADDELRQAWKAAGGICPLCEQPVKKGGQ